MSTENKALVRRLVEEVWAGGNLNLIDDLLAGDYVYRGPAVGEVIDRKAYKELISTNRTAFPDLRITIEDQLADGEKVVTRGTSHGTHRGPLMGIAATGKQVTVAWVLISRVKNGKIVEDWELYDALGMLQQLGVVAPLGKASGQSAG